MKLEIDHIYICVKKDAPEVKVLKKAGLLPASEITYHTGQGTASVFINFVNFYLEFVWIENIDELKEADQDLAEKFKHSQNGGSPFGIGLHRCNLSDDALPFRTYSFYSEWMKPNTTIEIVKTKDINDPNIFVVPPYMNWKEAVIKYPKLLNTIQHQAGLKNITNVVLRIPQMYSESKAMKVLDKQNLVNFQTGNDHVLELTFDNFKNNKTIDACPELPLNINY